jgi:tetratricopeptide (TPR) repeat protein
MYFRDEGRYREEVAIIGLVDGRRDVAEVIVAATGAVGVSLTDFRAFASIRSMIARGELELLNPVQMFQLGVEFHEEGQFEKARKLFLRAAERGLDDFDLGYRTAQTEEALGLHQEAAGRYQEFGDKCLLQFRTDEAVRSYRKACELDPGNMPRQAKLLKILLHENRAEEAITQGILMAGRFASAGKGREGLEVLLDLRKRGLKAERLGEKIISLSES